jgi:hypothetical protein
MYRNSAGTSLPGSLLAYVFEWSHDQTFVRGVFKDICMEREPTPSIESGQICSIVQSIAMIPKESNLLGGNGYYVRIRVLTEAGDGEFSEPVLSHDIPYDSNILRGC